MYTPSRYNVIVNRNDLRYVWNTLSGAVAVLDDNTLEMLSCGVNKISMCKTTQELIKNHILVASDFDEYGYVLSRANNTLVEQSPSDLHFVIAPTLRCNYHCEYCFEMGRTSFSDMTEPVISAIPQFVERRMDGNSNLKCLHVNWFGGEPLLGLNFVERLSTRLITLCRSRNIAYRGTLITNGRYLDEKTAEILSQIGIKRIQISIDGTEDSYCRSKRATKDDYLSTISNIAAAVRKGLPVVLRVNIRGNDFTSAYQLADLFFGEMSLSSKVKLYLAFVNEGDVKRRKESYAGFVEGEKNFVHYVYNKYSEGSYYNKLSFARGVSCSLSCLNNYCIGPEGELYKCEHHFGRKEYIVGSIFSKGMGSGCFSQEYERIIYASMRKEKCKGCKMFPICLGGCPNSNLLGEQEFDCRSYIEHLIECHMRRIGYEEERTM